MYLTPPNVDSPLPVYLIPPSSVLMIHHGMSTRHCVSYTGKCQLPSATTIEVPTPLYSMINMNLKMTWKDSVYSALLCILHHRDDFIFECLPQIFDKNLNRFRVGTSNETRRSNLIPKKAKIQKSYETVPLRHWYFITPSKCGSVPRIKIWSGIFLGQIEVQ